VPEFAPTTTELLFWNALALIVAACLFAPIVRRAGLGTILGYLAAGLAVQLVFPHSLAEHPEGLLHFSEFGVVLFLFVIGLELHPAELWAMRRDIFGLGLAQMLLCGAMLAVGAWLALPLGTGPAIVVGLGLALSSTALVMQTLDERNHRGWCYGRKSFAVLLFQDLAIVPLLLLVALLAPAGGTMDPAESLVAVGWAVAAILVLVLVGRYLLDPLFGLIARTAMPELMTAAALGVVIAAALLMDLVGMSYAMGSFLAGVMLAESSYRHQIEADIEPFRGLFLGLFFMAVGMSLDLAVVADQWLLILLAAPVAMLLKGVTIYGLGRVARLSHNDSVRLCLSLPQFGEFAFVLFTAAATAAVLPPSLASTLIAIVTVSMVLAPLMVRLEPVLERPDAAPVIEERFDDADGRVLLIGFGRFGQVVSQPLFGRGIDITILDKDPTRIQDAGRFGFRVHFGDGKRRDVLRAAGAWRVDLIVICVNDADDASEIVELVQAEYPRMPLYVRSYDRRHSVHLLQADVAFSVRETFESALRMGAVVLEGLGVAKDETRAAIKDIRRRDLARLRAQAKEGIEAGRHQLHTAPVRPEPPSAALDTTPNEIETKEAEST
jgi:CPA2 family monovalent cation:H+ antiporter-2